MIYDRQQASSHALVHTRHTPHCGSITLSSICATIHHHFDGITHTHETLTSFQTFYIVQLYSFTEFVFQCSTARISSLADFWILYITVYRLVM